MRFLTFLLVVALIGKISAQSQPYPRYFYRAAAEESSETDEPQSDEAEVENDNEEPQDDDASDEVELEKPPKFNRLFPAPQNGRPGSGGVGPTNFAFQTLMHEIDENGWKPPKENPNQRPIRQRAALFTRPAFRDDDDSDEEDEEDDEPEDDEAYSPDFDTMFPNPEGKQVGPTNMADSGPLETLGDVPASIQTDGYARSGIYRGRAQGPVYFTTQSNGRQSVRYVQRPAYVRASVMPVRIPSHGSGNRRVMQATMPYRQIPSYGGNRRVVQSSALGYRPSMGGYRRPSYNYRRPVYNNHMITGGHRQSIHNVNMGGSRQPGQVYVDNHGRRQQYVSSVVRRQQYVPMPYARRRLRQYPRSPYVVRVRRNNRFWSSH